MTVIVALDVPDRTSAEAMVQSLHGVIDFYKVGLELAYSDGGFDFVRRLVGDGKRVFLDLKLHDISTTVAKATAQVARLGATFLTVHAYPQTMRAAVEGRGDASLEILAVTVMTSYNDADLWEAGYRETVAETVVQRARQALEANVDGLILAGTDLTRVRPLFPRPKKLISPGIRLMSGASNDQKRIMTPDQARHDGADYLVVGRPITHAPDPRAAAEMFQKVVVAV
jgi:orotidine-5'-phosphate decarboxylase